MRHHAKNDAQSLNRPAELTPSSISVCTPQVAKQRWRWRQTGRRAACRLHLCSTYHIELPVIPIAVDVGEALVAVPCDVHARAGLVPPLLDASNGAFVTWTAILVAPPGRHVHGRVSH